MGTAREHDERARRDARLDHFGMTVPRTTARVLGIVGWVVGATALSRFVTAATAEDDRFAAFLLGLLLVAVAAVLYGLSVILQWLAASWERDRS